MQSGTTEHDWFAPLRRWFDASDPRARGALDLELLNRYAAARELRTEGGLALRFVPAASAPGRHYETAIGESGEVATRTQGPGMIHDWFNALAWLAFPRTKARLNALHVEALAAAAPVRAAGSPGDGPGGFERGAGHRGPLRDAATLFDENGAYVFRRDATEEAQRGDAQPGSVQPGDAPSGSDWPARALRDRDWPALFIDGRERFRREVEVMVVGHSLYEKLLAPYKAICAHAWVVASDCGSSLAVGARLQVCTRSDDLEAAAARQLRSDTLRASNLLPLPVLGVPGWWPANEARGFYDDAKVFRGAKRRVRRPAPGSGEVTPSRSR